MSEIWVWSSGKTILIGGGGEANYLKESCLSNILSTTNTTETALELNAEYRNERLAS
jgi:hypothetical protein